MAPCWILMGDRSENLRKNKLIRAILLASTFIAFCFIFYSLGIGVSVNHSSRPPLIFFAGLATLFTVIAYYCIAKLSVAASVRLRRASRKSFFQKFDGNNR